MYNIQELMDEIMGWYEKFYEENLSIFLWGIFFIILVLTSPLWIIPYKIYRVKKDKEIAIANLKMSNDMLIEIQQNPSYFNDAVKEIQKALL